MKKIVTNNQKTQQKLTFWSSSISPFHIFSLSPSVFLKYNYRANTTRNITKLKKIFKQGIRNSLGKVDFNGYINPLKTIRKEVKNKWGKKMIIDQIV